MKRIIRHKHDCSPQKRKIKIISPVIGMRCRNCGAERISKPPTSSGSDEPLTVEQRVDRLFDINEFPTYNEIVDTINDAEFDAVNFREIIAKRHGMRL